MIAYISGALVSAGENYIVIDNHGMGYRIFVSGKFLEHIPAYGTQIIKESVRSPSTIHLPSP
mgnify:CR=1 FL=1